MQYTTVMAEYTNIKVQVHAPASCHVNEGDISRAPITEIYEISDKWYYTATTTQGQHLIAPLALLFLAGVEGER